LKELSQILDCYYKCAIVNKDQNQVLGKYVAQFQKEDFLQELSVNETLRLFRGLFLMDGVPFSPQTAPLFGLYHSLVQAMSDKLNLSTWLTVIETCR
jgi:hypothetical protein